MQKHEKILKEVTEGLLVRNDLQGILLMGSVACGCATESSDLDIMVLCDENKFDVEYIDNIMVEIIYTTYSRRVELLNINIMEVYHFLHSRVIHDKEKLVELINIALHKYDHYIPPFEYIKSVNHWLESTRLKLSSALIEKNDAKYIFYASTNAWKVLEGIWIINKKPMPPSSSVLRFYNELTKAPGENWFEKLFSKEGIDTEYIIQIIDWILDELKQILMYNQITSNN